MTSVGDKGKVRVRIAPSPTGQLHLGTARTALFNFLFARSQDGEFLVRIEDTDPERSQPEYEKDILDNLSWLGLKSDTKPLRQSERTNIYKQYLQQLLDEDKAYICYCSKEELEAERQAMISQGLTPKYSGRCRSGIPKAGLKPQLIRLNTIDKKITFKDKIRGSVSFDSGLIGDFPIARSLDSPLFNFASAIDDADMKITHVIRGEDHLSNTPKQILILEALGFDIPEYAHLPLILAPGGGKLSKRDLDKSIKDFKEEGYLKEAIINFIAYLGWHPKEDKEMMSMEELISEFTLSRVQKGGASINMDKLDWLNSYYLRKLSADELLEALKPFLSEEWLGKPELLLKAIDIQKDRLKKLSEFEELSEFLFEAPIYDTKLLMWKDTPPEDIIRNLRATLNIIEDKTDHTEEKIVALADELGRGEVLSPLRVALSGQKNSPPPFELLNTLGRKESIRRLRTALNKLNNFS